MKANPTRSDSLVARHTARKVERIAEKTFLAFHAAANEWGTLSAEELFAIGTTLFMNITVKPMEKMTNEPREMRRQLCAQLQTLIKHEGNDLVN